MNSNRPTKTVFSVDHCEKIRQGRIGKKHSEETKAKMRAAHKRRAALKKKSVSVDVQGGVK